MTAPRSRRQVKHYQKFQARNKSSDTGCDLCKITKDSDQYVSETKHFKITRNIFPYSVWDSLTVTDHLMIVPKKHIESLAGLHNNSASEYLGLLSSYETSGYAIWARAPQSFLKSQPHQHTHLIKLSNHPIKALFFLRKPYIRFSIK